MMANTPAVMAAHQRLRRRSSRKVLHARAALLPLLLLLACGIRYSFFELSSALCAVWPWTRKLPDDLELVVFDLSGTTLDDLIDGEPIAGIAFRRAFAKIGLDLDMEEFNKVRGLEKMDAIRSLCKLFPSSLGSTVSDSLIIELYDYFNQAVEDLLFVGRLHEINGTSATFDVLRNRSVKVFVTSCFEKPLVTAAVSRLGWNVDGFLSSARKPSRDAIYEAMRRAGVTDKTKVLKVVDSRNDVLEGKIAGVWTAAVLTGTQSRSYLREAKPDFILNSIADIPSLLS